MQLLSELIHYKFFQNSWAGSKKHFHQGIGILYCTSKFAFAHTFCWQSPILIQGPTAKPTPIPDNQWFVYSHLFPIALLCHQYLRLLHLLWINENFHWNFIDHIFILIVQHIFCILGCTHIYKIVWIKYIQCSACSAVCPTKEMRKTISIFVAFENKISLIFIYKLVRHVALLGILLGTVCFLSAFTVVNLSGKIYVISCLYWSAPIKKNMKTSSIA